MKWLLKCQMLVWFSLSAQAAPPPGIEEVLPKTDYAGQNLALTLFHSQGGDREDTFAGRCELFHAYYTKGAAGRFILINTREGGFLAVTQVDELSDRLKAVVEGQVSNIVEVSFRHRKGIEKRYVAYEKNGGLMVVTGRMLKLVLSEKISIPKVDVETTEVSQPQWNVVMEQLESSLPDYPSRIRRLHRQLQSDSRPEETKKKELQREYAYARIELATMKGTKKPALVREAEFQSVILDLLQPAGYVSFEP